MLLIGENNETIENVELNEYSSHMAKIRLHSKMIFIVLYVVVICGTTIYLATKKTQSSNVDKGHFWVLTDSHVDDAYLIDGDPETYCHTKLTKNTTDFSRQYGHAHCNPPKELLVSALKAANQIDSSVDFIIWMGDATSHQFGQKDSILPTNKHLTEQLRKYFPETLIVPVLGNHDVVLTADPKTRFEEFYHETNYSLLLKDENARQTFRRGGYYSLRYRWKTLPDGQYLRFVVLNTGMFEPRNVKHIDSTQIAEQIQWFNRTMADAFNRNDRVLLLSHTPFGINENLLYRYFSLFHEEQLLAIINRYSSTIIMCLTGHRHQDILRLYSTSKTTLGILSHPAISPISWLTNPSIRRYSYNRTSFDLMDYDQYSLNLIETEQTKKDQWKFSYRFSSWYHQTRGLTSETLDQLIYLIRTDAFYLKRFLLLKHSAETTVLTQQKLLQTLCALTLFNFDDLIICTKNLREKTVFNADLIFQNHSLEMNPHEKEQSLQYRRLYRRVALSLISLLLVLSLLFTNIFRKSFFSSAKYSHRRE